MAGNVTASPCMPPVVWLLTPPDRPDGLLLAFPLWLILQGLSDFAMASLVGLLYVMGALEFAVAVVMALRPTAAPLVGAAALSPSLVLRGLGMRRLGANRPASHWCGGGASTGGWPTWRPRTPAGCGTTSSAS
jgi:hypothetical protein